MIILMMVMIKSGPKENIDDDKTDFGYIYKMIR